MLCKEQFSWLSLGDNQLYLLWNYKNEFFKGLHGWHFFSHILHYDFQWEFLESLSVITTLVLIFGNIILHLVQGIIVKDHEGKLILQKKWFQTFTSFTYKVKYFLHLRFWFSFSLSRFLNGVHAVDFLHVGLILDRFSRV